MPIQQSEVRQYHSNLRRLYVYMALTNASLWMPVWIVFLNEDRGLSLSQIYVIAGVGWVVQAVADVPSGALSDAIGRKRTVLIGVAVLGVGLGVLGAAPGIAGVATGYMLWAIGTALMSGTDQALLYESAVKAGRGDEFSKISSNSFQIVQGSQALGAIAGGLLASWRLDAPMIVTAAMTLAALGVLWGLLEPPLEAGEARPKYREAFSSANSFLRSDHSVAWLIVYSGLITGTVFFVPFVLFQPEMESHAVAVGWFGILFTGVRGASLLGSRYGVKIIHDRHIGKWLRGLPLAMALLFTAIAVSPTWYLAYASIVVLAAASAAVRPHIQNIMNQMLPNKVRATVLSTQSVVMTIFIAIMHPVVGAANDIWSIDAPFIVLGGLTLVAFIAYIPLARVVRGMSVGQEPENPKSGEASSSGSLQPES